MDSAILNLKRLNKIYPGGEHAVVNLDFDLEKGSMCALLGPNGAGKSTTIGMICGLVVPTEGSVCFNGNKVTRSSLEYRSRIGVVSQHTNLELDLSAYQNLKIHALLYNMPNKLSEKRIEDLLKLAGLYERKDNRVRSYSGGMKRKLQIIRSLLHDPQLLILDEPTVGLDPASREAIWDLILFLNKEGKTILFSTHYMEEAQRYARRVAIIHQGEIIRDGSSRSLIDKLGSWCRILYSEKGRKTEFFPSREEASFTHEGDSSQLIIRRTSLEDLFISITGKELD